MNTQPTSSNEDGAQVYNLILDAYYQGFNASHYPKVHPERFPVKECESSGKAYAKERMERLNNIATDTTPSSPVEMQAFDLLQSIYRILDYAINAEDMLKIIGKMVADFLGKHCAQKTRLLTVEEIEEMISEHISISDFNWSDTEGKSSLNYRITGIKEVAKLLVESQLKYHQ